IVALTKIDLIDDPSWLDLVEDDTRKKLKRTALSDAPIVRVSAKEGTNIQELRRSIEELCSQMAPKRDIGKPYLPVDRVFTIRGSGTVVTGTLVDGPMSQGDKVTVFPKNLQTRIRALESYEKKVDKVQPGSRVAINLVGLEKEELKRGDIVFGGEGGVKSSKIIDARVGLISQLTYPLKNNTELAVYLGTKEIVGKAVLLDRRSLKPGESAFAQIRFGAPVATRVGDRFIIRRLSPAQTVGGGVVFSPLASKHKFKDIEKVIRFLQRREKLEIDELILSELDKTKYMKVEDLLAASHYSPAEVTDCVKLLQNKNKLIVAGSWVIDSIHWQKQNEKVLEILTEEHSLHPLWKGVPQAELQNHLELPKELFSWLVAGPIESGKVVRDKDIVALSIHQPRLSPEQESVVSNILELLKRDRTSPPTKRELATQIPGSEGIVRFMCQQNMLVELPEGVLFEWEHYQTVKNKIIDFLKSNGTISIQQLRELFGFSRKHILPLLNKLDEEKVTRRVGDERVLAK
ncbi:SelB C-terminal domain-containing protein, partial [Chloroflexota bacterium]